MNVLVIGANGFIGSNLCKSLIRSGQSVTGVVRESSDLTFIKDLDSLRIVRGDVTDKYSLVAAMQGVSVVYNLAGLVSDWGPWDLFRKLNVEGVRNVMEVARQHKIRRVVHTSSVSVYGFPGGTDIDENTLWLTREDDPYSTTKAEGEKIALSYQSDQLDVTAIRPAGVYGPNDRTTTMQLVPVLLSRQFGYVDGGRHIMAPVYIDNLVQMMQLAAESENAPGQAFNGMDDGRVTWKEYTEWMCDDLQCKNPWLSVPRRVAWPLACVIEKAAKILNKKESPMINKYRIRAVMQDNHYNIQKAKSRLGYQPAVSTRDGIKKTIQWYLKYVNQQESEK